MITVNKFMLHHHGDRSVGMQGQYHTLTEPITFTNTDHYLDFVSQLSKTMDTVRDFPFNIIPVDLRVHDDYTPSPFSKSKAG